jgi:hypothetical protein
VDVDRHLVSGRTRREDALLIVIKNHS